MPTYQRILVPGGSFFFTLVTHQRRPIFQEELARQILREAFAQARQKAGPFQIDALCLLPDHLHCIWTLPDNDSNYSSRWQVLKAWFSRTYLQHGGDSGWLTPSMVGKGEAGIWQRRFWEHTIRDQEDLNRHIDYIHYNPVKHGLVQQVKDWPWSTFQRYVQEGVYAPDWGSEDPVIDGISAGE